VNATMVTESPAVVEVNPAVLKAARANAHLGASQAVAILNKLLGRFKQPLVDEARLLSWERGSAPTLEEAEALARTYLLPFAALFQDEFRQPQLTDFRMGPQGQRYSLSYETMVALDRFSRFYLAAKAITSALGMSEDARVLSGNPAAIRDQQDVEEFASATRGHLGVSDEHQTSWRTDEAALAGWQEAVEASGVFVFAYPLPVSELRGASRWELAGPPAILLNNVDVVPARIFTIIHEYAHLAFSPEHDHTILCDPSSSGGQHEERVANRIAAAVLVPRSILLESVPTSIPSLDYRLWPDRDKRRLRKATNASQAVIGIRLKDLGIVEDAGISKSFWRSQTPMRGRKRATAVRYRDYLGKRTLLYARRALDADLLSVGQLCRALGLKADDVLKLLS